MQNADIIFCPYNYMIDPSIRRSVSYNQRAGLCNDCLLKLYNLFWNLVSYLIQMNLDLNGHVLIFDEAHNMEDSARDASSFSLKQDDLQRAMQDCEKVGKCGTEPYAHSELVSYISSG